MKEVGFILGCTRIQTSLVVYSIAGKQEDKDAPCEETARVADFVAVSVVYVRKL